MCIPRPGQTLVSVKNAVDLLLKVACSIFKNSKDDTDRFYVVCVEAMQKEAKKARVTYLCGVVRVWTFERRRI